MSGEVRDVGAQGTEQDAHEVTQQPHPSPGPLSARSGSSVAPVVMVLPPGISGESSVQLFVGVSQGGGDHEVRPARLSFLLLAAQSERVRERLLSPAQRLAAEIALRTKIADQAQVFLDAVRPHGFHAQ